MGLSVSGSGVECEAAKVEQEEAGSKVEWEETGSKVE